MNVCNECQGKRLCLPVKTSFSIEPRYALLVGEAMIIYARYEGTIVDIISFYKCGYREGYYCHEMLQPSNLVSDLKSINDKKYFGIISNLAENFQQAVYLRNAICHSVTCGGKDGFDVLLFQTGTIKRGRKEPLKNLNPYRNTAFDVSLLEKLTDKMSRDEQEASKYFYELRNRHNNGEMFTGEPC